MPTAFLTGTPRDLELALITTLLKFRFRVFLCADQCPTSLQSLPEEQQQSFTYIASTSDIRAAVMEHTENLNILCLPHMSDTSPSAKEPSNLHLDSLKPDEMSETLQQQIVQPMKVIQQVLPLLKAAPWAKILGFASKSALLGDVKDYGAIISAASQRQLIRKLGADLKVDGIQCAQFAIDASLDNAQAAETVLKTAQKIPEEIVGGLFDLEGKSFSVFN